MCVRELRKLERGSGKVIKNTNPELIRLYDWSVTRTDEVIHRFTELARYLAVEAEQIRASQMEELAQNTDMINADQIPLTAMGDHDQLDTARTDQTTIASEKSATTAGSRRSRKAKGKRRSRRGRSKDGGRDSGVEALKRLSKDDMETVFQALNAPYDSQTMWSELVKLHEKNGDATIDWAEFLTGKKYINKMYLSAAFEAKKGRKKKGRKGGKARKGRIPFEICTLPPQAIYRRADGGPPIMYIPKQPILTDQTRFTAELPPEHPFQDDSAWYMNLPKREYISFHDAAKHNDIPSIRLAISEGYPVDTRNKFYKTPLMVAAHYGNLEAAIALIELGHVMVPITVYSRPPPPTHIRLMFRADVNARDNFKWTPLHHAAYSGMIDVVELLINNGALIDARALNGGTALSRAIECSRLNVVDYIMSKGAKVGLETRKGDNMYEVALAWADPRVIEHVHDKWELAQEVTDKKKQGTDPSRVNQTRPQTATSVASSKRSTGAIRLQPPDPMPGTGAATYPSDQINLTRGLDTVVAADDARVCPRYPWYPLPTRSERLARLIEARERYGWDHGLPGVPDQPFDRHLAERFEAVDVEAEAA
ncbi:unnamed protein product [Echinostoma caproni]|uniref:Uncharacterized protein n=1 Tax=Echinostoma caproni TaxID=27848 RepID=A0A3P8GR16_9TREM|nr:unnamed protein product [Echinostoma caproni]